MTQNHTTPPLAIVTGGGTGLGIATAGVLLEQGYRVLALGMDHEELPRHPLFQFQRFDVTDTAAIARLAGDTGPVKALVNAAGIILHEGREQEAEGFAKVMAVNLEGTRAMSWALRPALAGARGAVVNFASMWSLFGSARNPAYTASKGAVLALTRSMAVAWAAEGIRVNAVAPGWVKSRMSATAMADPARNSALMTRIPAGRWGEAHEVGEAVAWLLSDRASYVTGAFLPVDGGYSIA